MMNNLFNAIALVALIGAAFLAPAPPAAAPRTVSGPAANPVAPSTASPGPASTELRAQQPPVPVVRSVLARPAAAAPEEPAKSEARAPSPDRLERDAAKVAIEADGYKRVRIVDKGANGTWRAKAYRGDTEVVVMVDGAGRVLTE